MFAVVLIATMLIGCETTSTDTDGANDMGGDPNLEMTQVGKKFDVDIRLDTYNPIFAGLKDSVVVTKNEGGIVTFDLNFEFDSTMLLAADTLLGTTALPDAVKHTIIDAYLQRFGATLDTSDKEHIKVHAQVIAKVTADGIQEFYSSGGDLAKPFTVVKYGMNVGETWNFKNKDGIDVTRKVVSKSTTDDYALTPFFYIKVMKVEDTKTDPLWDKVTFIANHKFGLVGIQGITKDGKVVGVGIYPP